jgi:hypothetical protein
MHAQTISALQTAFLSARALATESPGLSGGPVTAGVVKFQIALEDDEGEKTGEVVFCEVEPHIAQRTRWTDTPSLWLSKFRYKRSPQTSTMNGRYASAKSFSEHDLIALPAGASKRWRSSFKFWNS